MLDTLFGIILFSNLNLTSGNISGPTEIPEKLNTQEHFSKLQEFGYNEGSNLEKSLFLLIESDDGGRSTLKIQEKTDPHPYAASTNESSIYLKLFTSSNKGKSVRGLYLINAAMKWMDQENILLPMTIDFDEPKNKEMIENLLSIGFKKSHVHMDKSLTTNGNIDEPNIRKANIFDLFDIVSLFIETSKWHQKIHNEVYWGSRFPVYKRYLQILRAMLLQDIILVSEGEKNLNGFCWGKILTEGAEIEEIFVREGSRSSGIGKSLLLNFEELVKRSGTHRVFFSVSGNNPKAISFYETNGYSTSSISLYKPLNK